ncbi:hypothetical protein [Mycobacterium riyadhense]|nr:hypothetical protein [Mycobacterium riyadhense]
MLFGIGLAWAHSPAPEAATDDPTPVAHAAPPPSKPATRIIAIRG